jgi:hypothetical protein
MYGCLTCCRSADLPAGLQLKPGIKQLICLQCQCCGGAPAAGCSGCAFSGRYGTWQVHHTLSCIQQAYRGHMLQYGGRAEVSGASALWTGCVPTCMTQPARLLQEKFHERW